LDFQASATEYVPRQSLNASLDELQRASDIVEEGVPLTDELAEALQHGTAIGGARPKALIDDGNRKYIAKFSSSSDTYSVVKGEYIAMRLAQEVGLDVAPVKLEQSMGRDVLLIERFDRKHVETGWSRKMLVSALTLFGLDEIMAAHASYTELAEIIRRRFTDPKDTLREMFSRMIFNILVGNTDDHARNHAAFWDGVSLTLTPAYDICPQSRNSREASQAMLMGRERRSQLMHGLAVAKDFHLSEEDARAIVTKQVKIIDKAWGPLCKEANLSKTDQKVFWRRQFLNELAFEGVEGQFYEQ
jgi:serine/threonine-protein kinase HipA